MKQELSREAVQALVESHDRFLRFLEARVGNRETAQDILQSAFVKTFERGEEIKDEESAVAWFYRVLRNSIVDHHRRRAVDVKAIEAKATALKPDLEDADLKRAVCQCVMSILPTLKPEYSEILHKVDLEGAPVVDVAREENLTPNNAMVRLHRARKALQGRLVQTCGTCTEHRCLDCHCKS